MTRNARLKPGQPVRVELSRAPTPEAATDESRAATSLACLLLHRAAAVPAAAKRQRPPRPKPSPPRNARARASQAEGELRSSKATPLMVPGADWASRQVDWMLADGSRGEEGRPDRALLRRGRQAGTGPGDDRPAAQRPGARGQAGRPGHRAGPGRRRSGGRWRYSLASPSVMPMPISAPSPATRCSMRCRTCSYLEARHGTLQWQRGQSGKRGGAELACSTRSAPPSSSAPRRARPTSMRSNCARPSDGVLMLQRQLVRRKADDRQPRCTPAPNTAACRTLSAMEIRDRTAADRSAGRAASGRSSRCFPLGRPEQAITSKLSLGGERGQGAAAAKTR